MPNNKLPPDFTWRQDGDMHCLMLDEYEVARIVPVGAGWVVQTVLNAPGIARQQLAVLSVERGKRWASSWLKQRLRLVVEACNRQDLAPPVSHGPARRHYKWQNPTWARAS